MTNDDDDGVLVVGMRVVMVMVVMMMVAGMVAGMVLVLVLVAAGPPRCSVLHCAGHESAEGGHAGGGGEGPGGVLCT